MGQSVLADDKTSCTCRHIGSISRSPQPVGGEHQCMLLFYTFYVMDRGRMQDSEKGFKIWPANKLGGSGGMLPHKNLCSKVHFHAFLCKIHVHRNSQ